MFYIEVFKLRINHGHLYIKNADTSVVLVFMSSLLINDYAYLILFATLFYAIQKSFMIIAINNMSCFGINF